jgi:hypothetical protein
LTRKQLVLWQARSQAIEAQLASTTAELQTLKSRHQQLETMLARASQTSQDTLAQMPTSEVLRHSQTQQVLSQQIAQTASACLSVLDKTSLPEKM